MDTLYEIEGKIHTTYVCYDKVSFDLFITFSNKFKKFTQHIDETINCLIEQNDRLEVSVQSYIF